MSLRPYQEPCVIHNLFINNLNLRSTYGKSKCKSLSDFQNVSKRGGDFLGSDETPITKMIKPTEKFTLEKSRHDRKPRKEYQRRRSDETTLSGLSICVILLFDLKCLTIGDLLTTYFHIRISTQFIVILCFFHVLCQGGTK